MLKNPTLIRLDGLQRDIDDGEIQGDHALGERYTDTDIKVLSFYRFPIEEWVQDSLG
jgi:hypothetical protein